LPSLQSPHKSIEFFVIGGVVEMTPFELLTTLQKNRYYRRS